MPKRHPEEINPEARPRIYINFNRPIMDHRTIQILLDTLAAEKMVTGSAVSGAVEDLQKLRYLCEDIIALYKKGEHDRALQGIHTLMLVL